MQNSKTEREMLASELFDLIVNGDDEKGMETTEKLLEIHKMDPKEVLNSILLPAMRHVGELYSNGEYFIADMVISADAFRKIMDQKLAPLLTSSSDLKDKTVAVFGTVRGDIHDLGKNLATAIFRVEGIDVIDLGTDVTPEKFASTVADNKASIVGMSALMTTTMSEQKNVIEELRKRNLKENTIVVIGGAPVTEDWAREIGADVCGSDVFKALSETRKLLEARTHAGS